ncbi:hypothetical protein EDB86DRAFT_3087907 [Lactarius hatsudake]|nr:hypothetical protein EDB86DRAFT_3087907 [Lactarius hatsudake]
MATSPTVSDEETPFYTPSGPSPVMRFVRTVDDANAINVRPVLLSDAPTLLMQERKSRNQ